MPRPEREVEYVAFVEIVHGRWVRIDVTAPSPERAVREIRDMKFQGRISLGKQHQITEYDKEGTV